MQIFHLVQAIIIPIYKKGDRENPSNYRSISLIDSLVKILGRVLLERLETWVKDTQTPNHIQYVFRKGVGTTEQCLNLTLLVEKYTVAKGEALHLVFMDLSSAVDSVSHSKLRGGTVENGSRGGIVKLDTGPLWRGLGGGEVWQGRGVY